MACDILPPSTCACLLPFEQLIGQQMVHLQVSILECLHHHTFSNMFSNGTSTSHHTQILSCSSPRVGVWLVIWLIFPTFWLSSPIFCTTFRMWLGLPHPSIACMLWCVCTHPIYPMGIHLLCCARGNECTGTHDVIRDTFGTIARDVGFHMRQKQLHGFFSTTFNSFHRWINNVFNKNGIRILADVVIVDPMRVDLLPWSCATQRFATSDIT